MVPAVLISMATRTEPVVTPADERAPVPFITKLTVPVTVDDVSPEKARSVPQLTVPAF